MRPLALHKIDVWMVDSTLTRGALCLRLSRLVTRRILIPAGVACAAFVFAMAKHPTSIQAQKNPNGAAGELARDPRVARALDYLAKNSAAITEEQVKITEIPAPPFQETQRAAYLKNLFAATGVNPRTDDAGNVIAEFGAAQNGEVVVLTAHLDTVFPAGTNTTVRRDKNVLYAPGISDNGTGLASIVALARAFADAKIKTQRGVVFAADVGEEGEGNLRGARKLVETYGSRLKAMIAVDGASTDYVVAQALASRRLQVTITGPGGHSWSDFGTPNPINAIARGINRFLQVPVPGSPKTTYNVGEIEGGNSVNAIPASASIKVDFRSEQERELGRLETALRDAMKEGIASEMNMARERGQAAGKDSELQMEVKSLGVRPGGELAPNSPLLVAVQEADMFLGNRSNIERSSTDANIPLSLGIPAISLGGGGRAGGAHTLGEWYDPSGREMGLQRLLLTTLAIAGIEK